MTARGCKYSADSFCYVCGEFFAKRTTKHCLNNCIRAGDACLAYFGMPVGDQEKRWAPHVICDYCRCTLRGLVNRRKKSYQFCSRLYLAQAFRSPYRLQVPYGGSNKTKKGKNAPPIQYPDIASSIAPVPHNTTDLPLPQPPS